MTVVAPGENTTNGKRGWSSEEDDFIKEYVEDHGKNAAIWDELAGAMNLGHGRTASAVRSRWYMLCGPSAATGGRSKAGFAKRQERAFRLEEQYLLKQQRYA